MRAGEPPGRCEDSKSEAQDQERRPAHVGVSLVQKIRWVEEVGRFKRRVSSTLSAITGSFRAKACHRQSQKRADDWIGGRLLRKIIKTV